MLPFKPNFKWVLAISTFDSLYKYEKCLNGFFFSNRNETCTSLTNIMLIISSPWESSERQSIKNALKDISSHSIKSYVISPGNELGFERVKSSDCQANVFKTFWFFKFPWKSSVVFNVMIHDIPILHKYICHLDTSFSIQFGRSACGILENKKKNKEVYEHFHTFGYTMRFYRMA